MAQKINSVVLFIVTLFLGWFGIDKLIVYKDWKTALIKFLLCFLIIGEIWNIYDLVCICIGKYKRTPFSK